MANYNKEDKVSGAQSIELTKITKSNGASNYLGVAGNFKAILGENVEGDYGLRINIAATNENGQEDNRIYYLRSSDNMIGNIYNFSSFIPQQARFDISKLNVSEITVEFFQAGNFKDGNGDNIGWQYNDQLLPDNIFVKDIELYYGIDNQTEENKLIIYTEDGLTYNSRDISDYNKKTIKLRWQHLDLTAENAEIQIIESKQDARGIFGDNSNLNVH